MSYPDVQNLFYGPMYEAVTDFSYPYKPHSGHSLQSLPSSILDDNRDFGKLSSRSIAHMSSHNASVPERDDARYSPPSYSVHSADPSHHPLYQAPSHLMDQHHYGLMYAPNYHTGWGGIEPLSMPPDASMSYNTMSFPEAPRLTPPPPPPVMAGQRVTLTGSLDPTTGFFYRTPEHPRLRTAQACEKCRTRKAKCSGEHPSCQRCVSRGLPCEYAKEGRVRGPNKVKAKTSISAEGQSGSSTSTTTEEQDGKSDGASMGGQSRRNSTDKGLYSPKSSSPARHNPLISERRMSRTRPPHLRLDIMTNKREATAADLQNNQLALMNDAEAKHEVGGMHGIGGNELVGDQHVSFLSTPRGHYIDSNPTPRASQGWQEVAYLSEGSFHEHPITEMYHPIPTFPQQSDDSNLQYQHTTEYVQPLLPALSRLTVDAPSRRSIGSLSFSTGTTSSISSPVTPHSTTHTMHDISGGSIGERHPDLQMVGNYSEGEPHTLATAWQDANQLHLPLTTAPVINDEMPALDKVAWVADAMPLDASGSEHSSSVYPQVAYHEGHNIQDAIHQSLDL